MKSNAIKNCLILSIAAFFLSVPAFGVPKYTNKETALALAKMLDKGRFHQFTISSTYVQNENNRDYYISVILSNGSSQKWYIDQIYKWSRDDIIRLSNNRSLLFRNLEDSRFDVLNKNKFHEMALKANVYIKTFPEGDPLAGKQFRFRIKSFNLINPSEIAYGRDRTGSKYRYLVELFNGLTEQLTYEDAYRIFQDKHLLREDTFTLPTLERAYQVTGIVAREKENQEGDISPFGIEVQFDQEIELEGEHFPYEIYERKQYNKRTRKSKKEFVLDITIPNSEMRLEIPPIKNLEYLYDIQVVRNPKYRKRLFLRASLNPTVFNIPPVVDKNGDKSVYITFFNVVDQTIPDRGVLLNVKSRAEVERRSEKTIQIKVPAQEDSDFTRAFEVAREMKVKVHSETEAAEKRKTLREGIKLFEKAALQAKTDKELISALSGRNEMREEFIVIALDSVKAELGKETGSYRLAELKQILDQAEAFTNDEKDLQTIEELRNGIDKQK